MSDQRVLLNAPTLPIETDWKDTKIRPCFDCLPWHAEVTQDDDLRVRLVEFHAIGCPIFDGCPECGDDTTEGSYCAECGRY